jgi:undecaprenyl-diphosphatase
MGTTPMEPAGGRGPDPMPEFLRTLDVALFRFINGTLANPVTDVIMPFLTDLNQTWVGRIIIVGALVLLVVRGGKPGRAAVLLLIPVIALGDQLSSNIIKGIFMRPRPCHIVDGATAVEGVRLLVGCGGGFSFPSSHAVNHFAAATLLAHYYPRWKWYLFAYAAIIGLSRIFVGVHYPSDVAGGMLIGGAVGWFFILVWAALRREVAALAPYGPPGASPPAAGE